MFVFLNNNLCLAFSSDLGVIAFLTDIEAALVSGWRSTKSQLLTCCADSGPDRYDNFSRRHQST